MDLFPSEEYLVQSNNDRLVLTTHRLQLTSKDWGSSYKNILFIEDISSIEVRYSSLVIALVIGVFALIGGLMWANDSSVSQLNIATISGIILIIVYFLSRRYLVSITPNGGKPLNFEIGQMSTEEVNDFIDKVQLAKHARRTNSRANF